MALVKNPVAARNLLAIIVFVVLLAIAVANTEEASGSEARPIPLVICDEFGKRYCAEALEVSWCESRFKTSAQNGQYRGLFQMGSWERRTFGHGSSAEAQAEAAERYFIRTGRDWSPWDPRCRP